MPDRCHCPILGRAQRGGRPATQPQAMQSVLERLVRPQDRLLLLFTPPFDKTPRDPGYIKGYLPGIRENGGQYTHAATWTAWAFASLGTENKRERSLTCSIPSFNPTRRKRLPCTASSRM